MKFHDYKFSPWRVKGDQRIVASEAMWKQPINMNRLAKAAGERRRVLVVVDVFEDWNGRMRDASGLPLERSIIPGNWWNSNGQLYGPDDGKGVTMADVRDRLFRLIASTPNLDWLLLTKRPENMLRLLPERWVGVREKKGIGYTHYQNHPPRNVWIGTSVENQEQADARIPHLLTTPAAVRFLSVEPLLGPVDLSPWLITDVDARDGNLVDWVIVGGESGHGARPCNVEWIRSIVRQCRAAGVPCFVKQLGTRPTQDARKDENVAVWNLMLEDLAGGDPAEWPEDLRVRELPKVGGES